MKKRLTSPVVWISVIAQIVLIVALINPTIADYIKIIATSLVEIATLIGILNNPTDKEGF